MPCKLFFVIFSLSFLAACASYEPTARSIAAPSKAASFSAENEGLSAYATVLAGQAQQENYFDADLTDINVVAVQLMAENQTSVPRSVNPNKVRLELPDGRALSPLDPTSVAYMVDEDGSVTGSMLAFGVLGYMAAVQAEADAKTARSMDYRNKAFEKTLLYEGQAHHGVLFFSLPLGSEGKLKGTLDIPFLEEETSQTQIVSVPLGGHVPQATTSSSSSSGAVAALPAQSGGADTSTENQSLDGLWVARGIDWVAEIYVTGNSFDIDLTCTATAYKYTSQGVIDDDGEVGYVKLSPFRSRTPTLTGNLESMQLNARGFSCTRDELRFERV